MTIVVRRTDAIAFDLPYPPSANVYWRIARNRVYVSKEAKRYKDAVGAILAVYTDWLNWPLFKGKVEVQVSAYVPSVRADLSNCDKVLLDALTGIVYEDDVQVHKLVLERFEPKPPKRKNAGVLVRVCTYEPPAQDDGHFALVTGYDHER